MNRRQSLIIVSILIVLFIATVLIFSPRQAKFSTAESYSVSNYMSAVAEYNDTSLVYSNGSSLILYNYTNGQVSSLSPSFGANGDNIDSISVTSGSSYVIFHAQATGISSALAQQFQASGVSSPFGYWIVYNTSSQTFSALPSSVVIAKASGSNVAAIESSVTGEQIAVINPSSLSVTKSVSIQGSTNFLVTSQGYLLQNSSNNLLITKDGVVSEPVASNSIIIGQSSSNEALIIVGQGSARQLALLNLTSYKIQNLASPGVTGTPVLNNNIVLYATSDSGSNDLHTYDLTSHKDLLWVFGGQLANDSLSALGLVLPIKSDAAIISLSSNSYYLVGNLAKPDSSI